MFMIYYKICMKYMKIGLLFFFFDAILKIDVTWQRKIRCPNDARVYVNIAFHWWPLSLGGGGQPWASLFTTESYQIWKAVQIARKSLNKSPCTLVFT